MRIEPADTQVDVAEWIASHLVTTDPHSNGFDVRTPLLYPSGASVVLNISNLLQTQTNRDMYELSDLGLGFSEAFAMDISNGFSRAAKELSVEYGVRYDRRRLFIPEVGRDQLPSAVRLVANCSQSAVILAAERATERRAEERTDRLYRRLKGLFPDVAKRVEMRGASSTNWTVDALLKVGDRQVAFDVVANHANSVAATSTKFHDLALREDAPARCATVENKRAMGTLLAVLAQSASVIEDKASDKTMRQLAMAS